MGTGGEGAAAVGDDVNADPYLCEWPGGCNRVAKTTGAITGRRLCLGHLAEGAADVRRRWRAPGRLACEACLTRDRKRKARGRPARPGRWSAKARRDAVFAYERCPRMRIAALFAGVFVCLPARHANVQCEPGPDGERSAPIGGTSPVSGRYGRGGGVRVFDGPPGGLKALAASTAARHLYAPAA